MTVSRSPLERSGYQMLQAGTRQRRKDPRFAMWIVTRWLVLLLVLIFATSGLVNGSRGDHVASPASLTHDVASLGPASTGERPCAAGAEDAHGTTCCIGSLCSSCVPLPASAAIAPLTVAEVVLALPGQVYRGLTTSPGFRPPSLSANV